MDENKWNGFVAVDEIDPELPCTGCAFEVDSVHACPCRSQQGGPECTGFARKDGRNIIWIRENGEPSAEKLPSPPENGEPSLPSSLTWYRATEKLPPEEELVLVVMRNKNKEDGILLFDVATHDGDAWRPRQNSWEDIIAWALPTAPEKL